jgi:four helix bundle protein
MRRAAVSISSNIAEGAGRNSNKEFIHFLGIAVGSAYELQTQILISERLQLISEQTTEQLANNITELLKMAYVFKKTLTNDKTKT